jgi:GWxTD domain-containing protein
MPLETWIHTPLAQAVGLALLHSLWEGVLIAVILAAMLCLARSSRARYGAACVAMLLMLASFGVTLIRVMPAPMDLAKSPRFPVRAPAVRAGLPMVPVDVPAPSRLTVILPWIAPFWAAGVLLFHMRALGGWMAARRLRRSGVCRPPGEWQQRFDGLAARLRVSKPAALLESCLADAPVVIGYIRPVILMPVGLLAGLPVAQVEAILIHELAHIRRQDYLVNLLQTFIEALLFYHPAVWWMSGVIRAERENCCDDLAVAATGDARQYAAALAALEQNRWAAHDLALAATGGSLVKRIRRLLQQPERPHAAWTPVISAGLLVISAGIAFASWQTQPAPKPPATIPAVAPAGSPDGANLVVADTIHNRVPVWNHVPITTKPAPKLLAQAQQASQAPPLAQSETNAGPLTEKQRKAMEKGAREELATPYKKWLNEDVAYIITDAERAAFKQTNSDEEREHFIEQFWQVRDPTPGTPENEFKEEHYRRIAYANEHFANATTGLPGWKTDRGRIYITYGPPDEIEDHSSGGFYQRPPQEGGGTTSTYPFQQWRYRYIDGIGNNIIIEFVDPTMSGEFRMTADPSEKDALAKAGTPVSFAMRDITMAPSFQRLQPSQALTKFPESGDMFVSVGDGPKVTLSVTSEKMNTYFTFPLPSAPAKYDIVAQVTDTTNYRAVANLRDVTVAGQIDYTSRFAVKTGSYTLKVLVRDLASGAMQTSTVSFYVK